MVKQQYSRTAMLIGEEGLEKLRHSHIAVFGCGGVGGYAIEALARCGIGAIDIFDGDTVSESNINRQIIALSSTVGMYKTDAMAERIALIDSTIRVTGHKLFITPENASSVDFSRYDAVIDAIDTVSGKLEIIVRAKAAGAFVISAMGAGNKLDPLSFEVSDIYKTSVCPLARVMRHELKKRGINELKVVYSKEKAIKPVISEVQPSEDKLSEQDPERGGLQKAHSPGSISFMPSVSGLIIASETVKALLENKQKGSY